MASRSAEIILMNEFKELSKEKWVNVELAEDKIFSWDVALMIINPESLYYGGYFKAKMSFPSNYPHSPPNFQFNRPLLHPNIYPDGKLCISILHAPGDDATSGESASERWSPAQRVETVLLSIISLLDDAECSSPANVDAGVLLRKDFPAYKARVKEDVETGKADIPPGFVMPTHESTAHKPTIQADEDDAAFWADSDEGDFGEDDSDSDSAQEDDEDENEDLQQEEDTDAEMPDTDLEGDASEDEAEL